MKRAKRKGDRVVRPSARAVRTEGAPRGQLSTVCTVRVIHLEVHLKKNHGRVCVRDSVCSSHVRVQLFRFMYKKVYMLTFFSQCVYYIALHITLCTNCEFVMHSTISKIKIEYNFHNTITIYYNVVSA